jgi:hypothetical protein
MSQRDEGFSEKDLFNFEFQRFSLLNQKASFVLTFGSIIVAILFGVLDIAAMTIETSVFGLWLIAIGISGFLVSDILSIFIIFPRYIKGDLTKKEKLLNATNVIKDQNGLFGRLLEWSLLFLLAGITAISFSLLSLLFSSNHILISGWILSFGIPIATKLILTKTNSKQSTVNSNKKMMKEG